MRSFHEMVEDDITDEFMDLSIFGEFHQIDGRKVLCVFDTDVRKQDQPSAAPYGITDCDLVIFARAADLPRGREGERVNIDGRFYVVAQWRVDMGVYRIALNGPVSH